MSPLVAATLAIVAALVAVALAYGRDALRGGAIVPAALRAGAIALLVYAAADGPVGAPATPGMLVAIDGSASAADVDPAGWSRRRDSLGAEPGTEAVVVFGGDTLLDAGEAPDRPGLATSRIAPLVRRATELGRPFTAWTDREIDDPEALADAPPGSRIVDLGARRADDLAIVDLEAPVAVAPGDTMRLAIVIGVRGSAAARTVRIRLDDRVVAERPVPALATDGESRIVADVVVPAGPPVALLRAELVGGSDARPADDSVGVVVARDDAPRVVLASTAPDGDARDLAAALRESAGAPVRAFYRLAPGRWVRDGALAPVGEDEVRRALRGASLAVLHGDTAWAGAPATLAARALLLVVPPVDVAPREGYVGRPLPSPLQPALAALATESLPPLLVGAVAPRGTTVALTAAPTPADRRGTPVLVVDEGRTRRVVLAAGGWARWRRRGGASAAAAQALLGAPLDWLAAARGGAARPTLPAGVIRAGVPIPVTRGTADTATLDLVRDGDRRAVRVALRFDAGRATAAAPPLDPGTWRGRLGGAPVTLVVNAARELLPRRPTVAAGPIGGPAMPLRRGARAAGAFYLAAALALAAEWFLRRRAGLR